jgi:ABC-type uncharacterized transport system ATPase component
VVVTHDLKVGSYGKRLIVLNDGRIIRDEEISTRFTPLPQDIYTLESA